MSKTRDKSLPYRLQMALEFLPGCRMDLRKAAVKAGYSATYAKKLIGRFAREPKLQEALCRRVARLLEEAGQSDRMIVAAILHRWHFDAHRTSGAFITQGKRLPLSQVSGLTKPDNLGMPLIM